tara:strand:- start:49 stop:402 length:354 start_codon:yes stop_codon:yes gene_type:complete
MTKKLFKKLALEIALGFHDVGKRKDFINVNNSYSSVVLGNICWNMGEYFLKENPLFNYDLFLLEITKQQIRLFKEEFEGYYEEGYEHYRKHYKYLLNQKKEHEENINTTIKKMKKAS